MGDFKPLAVRSATDTFAEVDGSCAEFFFRSPVPTDRAYGELREILGGAIPETVVVNELSETVVYRVGDLAHFRADGLRVGSIGEEMVVGVLGHLSEDSHLETRDVVAHEPATGLLGEGRKRFDGGLKIFRTLPGGFEFFNSLTIPS